MNLRRQVEAGVLGDCGDQRRGEHEAVGERLSKREGCRVEPPPGDCIASAADLQVCAAACEVDRRYLVLLVRLPDRINRPRGAEISNRGLQAEDYICGPICRN